MIENSALFAAYNHIQNLIRTYTHTPQETPLSLPQLATAGFLSGAFVSLILTPIELVKCRLQVQDVAGPRTVNYKGPLSIITHTLKTDGVKGFYRGHLGTFLREAGGGAAWFGTYEVVVAHFLASHTQANSPTQSKPTKDDLPAWQLMAAGALAGMAFNAALFPADVIKSRQQTEESSAGGKGKGFWETGRDVWKGGGVRGFYRGCGITVARSAPTSAVIFATYVSAHCLFVQLSRVLITDTNFVFVSQELLSRHVTL